MRCKIRLAMFSVSVLARRLRLSFAALARE